MPDAITSDHPTVESTRITCSEVGRTGRLRLLLPTNWEPDGYVRLLIDGDRTHAPVGSTLEGEPAIEGAYANRRLARATEGTNLLQKWLDERGYGPGETLVVDRLTEGQVYGLREPGARVVYEPVDPPDTSLSEIAESLDE